MTGNDDLHPILSKIHETIGDLLVTVQEVKGEVQKVHTAITEAADSIRDAIHENIQAQAELKMMEHVVEVQSIVPQIEAENERIQIEEQELDESLDRIAERYERKHEELDEKAASRIRDLGSHIFEVDEQEFEDGIESPFTEHVTTAWTSLQAHNDAVERERKEQVETRTGDIVTDVHEFVQRQEELVDRIDGVRAEFGDVTNESHRVQLPYYAVTVERGGATETHVVGPSIVETDEEANATLRTLPGMDELISRTELNGPRSQTLTGESVRRALAARNVDDDRPLVSYGSAVENAIPGQVEVTVEGGE